MMSTTEGQLLKLAAAQLPDLADAESTLLHAVAVGEFADYSDPNGANDPEYSEDWGKPRTIRAKVIRWLCVDREAMHHVDPKGLRIHAAKIEGRLDLDSVTVPFPLVLVRCAIHDGIDLSLAETRLLSFAGSYSGPISGARLSVRGDLILGFGFRAEGEVSLDGAAIAGSLDCTGGVFRNPPVPPGPEGTPSGGIALNADGVTVKGPAFLRNGFRAEGFVRLVGATIGVYLDLKEAQFGGECPNGLIAQRMAVAGIFNWREITTTADTRLTLAGAQIGQLADDEPSWPPPGQLDLDGFVYTAIFDGPLDAKARMRWLGRQSSLPLNPLAAQPSQPQPFRPQPYQQLAKVLREHGQETEAKQILQAKERARRNLGSLGWWARCWNRFLGWSMAYGYQPQRLLIGAMVFVLLGWGLFAAGSRANMMIPTQAETYTVYERTGQVPPSYPAFCPFMYALDTLVPIVNFGQKDYWRPRDTSPSTASPQPSPLVTIAGVPVSFSAWPITATWITSHWFLRGYRWFLIGIGWLLITLGIAGVTSLVRKD
jgi:hypothetical protein